MAKYVVTEVHISSTNNDSNFYITSSRQTQEEILWESEYTVRTPDDSSLFTNF